VLEADMKVWKMNVQLSVQWASLLESNLESMHALIKGKSSMPTLEKVEAQQGHAAVHQARNPVGLLKLVKE
jgi:hypothetical protein